MPIRKPLRQLPSLLICLGLLTGVVGQADEAVERFWTAHVEPLFQERCFDCHRPPKVKSGLDLSSLQTILKGGDRGAGVIPGRPDDSQLYQALKPEADPHMPPKKQLSEEQIGLVRTWIEKLGSPAAQASVTNSAATNYVAEAKPRKPVWMPPAKMAAPEVIDRFLELGWKERGVKPARRAGDATFVRRVYLDLIGRIPTAAETDRFLKNRGRDKRARLVDELLTRDEYARHLREVFDFILMGRRGPEFEQQRTDNRWFAFLERSFRENRPWNEVVRDLIVARPEPDEDRGEAWFLYERKNNPQAMAEALAPVVFGVQIKCAQCHDHMVAREIKQAHYWGMVAAFNRTKNVETETGIGLAESAIGGFVSFANLKKESQPALLTFFNGRRVDEPWPKEGEKETDAPEKYLVAPPPEKTKPKAPALPKFSRRAALADAVTQDNPLLARAMVNRVWAMLLGRGLVHPVDLMDSKHPASHPDLLDWLARDFEQSGYDVKRLIRNLTATRAYQLDSRLESAERRRGGVAAASRMSEAGSGKKDPSADASAPMGEGFARAMEKPLSAEQLFRSLLVATGNEPAADGKVAGRSEKELRHAFIKEFPDLFAPDYNATLQQAMFLSNSPLLDDLLKPREGNLTEQLSRLLTTEARVQLAFSRVLGREPDRIELTEATRYLADREPEAGAKQLVWALLTGVEFQVNH
jgi:mono/diheme cytochrome c family protein